MLRRYQAAKETLLSSYQLCLRVCVCLTQFKLRHCSPLPKKKRSSQRPHSGANRLYRASTTRLYSIDNAGTQLILIPAAYLAFICVPGCQTLERHGNREVERERERDRETLCIVYPALRRIYIYQKSIWFFASSIICTRAVNILKATLLF